jgi:cysteine desulfurase
MRARHYCDYNAGAPARPEAVAALSRALEIGGNASSVHGFGRAAKALIEDARETLCGGIGSQSQNLIFTSGATEALHLALEGARASGAIKSLVISAIEHDALHQHARAVGLPIVEFGASATGVVDLDALAAALAEAPKPALVALMLANNETGVIQPVHRAAAIAREHGAFLLVDAAQAFGRVAVNIADLDAAYLTLSAHKIGGAPGAGALILAPGAPFAPSRLGGGQERGARPGTENAPAIAAFAAAAKINRNEENARVAALRDRFEQGLLNDAIVFGKDAPRLGNTSYFALPGLSAETSVIAFDLEGVAVSSGSACSSGKVRQSRVLAAMGVAPHVAKAALRVSFGWASTEADVDAALIAVHKIAARRASVGAV